MRGIAATIFSPSRNSDHREERRSMKRSHKDRERTQKGTEEEVKGEGEE